jgi:hypothetical protein
MSRRQVFEFQKLLEKMEPILKEVVERSFAGEELFRECGVLTPEELATRLR